MRFSTTFFPLVMTNKKVGILGSCKSDLNKLSIIPSNQDVNSDLNYICLLAEALWEGSTRCLTNVALTLSPSWSWLRPRTNWKMQAGTTWVSSPTTETSKFSFRRFRRYRNSGYLTAGKVINQFWFRPKLGQHNTMPGLPAPSWVSECPTQCRTWVITQQTRWASL